MTGKGYHRLLERQLKKFFPGYPEITPEMEELFRAINNSYEHFDNDRVLMETAMRESSDELTSKKTSLNDLLMRQSHVLESLKDAARSLFPEQDQMANEDLLQLADLVQEEIHKRHVAESQKAQSDQRLLDIIERLSLGMARYDAQGRLTQVEQRFAEIFGQPAEQLVGRIAGDFRMAPIASDESETSHAFEFAAINAVFEAPLITPGKEEMWLLCTTAPLLDAAGAVEGGVIVVFDITKQKILEREMREAKKAAEAGLELRKSILANVSHELRTPVNAIVGMASLLASTPLNDQQQEYLATMRFSSDGLLVLIDDLLDVSRIESGKVELEDVDFSLKDNFTQLTKALQLKAMEKGLSFSLKMSDGLAARSSGDVHRLNQVLTNLISNAIKFTPKGSVELSISPLEENDAEQQITFSVSDTGIGISSDRQVAIFQAFTQEDSSTTRKYGGTGLGLSISKKLVEMMGGQLQLESSKDSGSRFYFTIPLKRAKSSTSEVKVFNPDLKGARILLVEDNKVNQYLALALLNAWNAQTEVSEDGVDAVERLKDSTYDLVLMDLQMPLMDGFEATLILRNELHLKTPVIGLSANALNGEHERSLEIGMNDYVSKPFQPELLYEKIYNFIRTS
jgi:PAS domain S-box-containing protein